MTPRLLPISHGTTLQQYRRCRDDNDGDACELCISARKRRNRADYDQRVARLLADPTLRPHGEENTYTNWGCRCDECNASHFNHSRGRDNMRLRPRRLSVPRGPKKRKIPPFGREWIDV